MPELEKKRGDLVQFPTGKGGKAVLDFLDTHAAKRIPAPDGPQGCLLGLERPGRIAELDPNAKGDGIHESTFLNG